MARTHLDRSETIALEFEQIAKDPSVPKSIRDMAGNALEDWLSLPPEERAKRLVQYFADLERRYEELGKRMSRRPRTGRPPQGALPAIDDTPWAPRPAAVRKKK